MLMATTDLRTEYQVLGLVRGSSIRARHLGMDILAALRKLVGGSIPEYGEMIEEAREEALAQMEQRARALGANAVVGIRLASTTVTHGAAEVIAYGTAVKI